MLKIVKPNKKIKIESINKFENEFDLKLPEDYKEFLLKYNGGIVEEDFYFYLQNKQFNHFSMYLYYDLSTIISDFNTYVKGIEEDLFGFLENKISPIGRTRGDFEICISFDKRNNGKIYIFDQEETSGKPFILISNSFTKFMNSFIKED